MVKGDEGALLRLGTAMSRPFRALRYRFVPVPRALPGAGMSRPFRAQKAIIARSDSINDFPSVGSVCSVVKCPELSVSAPLRESSFPTRRDASAGGQEGKAITVQGCPVPLKAQLSHGGDRRFLR